MKKDWIKLKYDVSPNVLICERCKQEVQMPDAPTPISIFLAIMKEFGRLHRHCKEEK
jgi:hypothetical protein